MMSGIFISYSRQSHGIASSLVADIEDLGYTVWIDKDLSGGQAWWDQILSAIRSSHIFVFLLDADGLNSTACQREFRYAAALGKPILPVLVADGISTNLLPPELSTLQFIDYKQQDRKSAFALARALAAVPPTTTLPDPLPAPPVVPVSYLGGLTQKLETTSTLSYEEQSALLVDLRRSLRDPKTSRDGRALLVRLRARRDLFAAIAEEIDELLDPPAVPEPVPRIAPAPTTPPPASPPLVVNAENKPVSLKPPVRLNRAGAVVVGAVAGCIVGPLAFIFAGQLDKIDQAGFLVPTVAGMIAAAITGTYRRVVLISMGGFVLGVALWSLADHAEDLSIVRAMLVGGGLGAILGATVGTGLKKWKRWP